EGLADRAGASASGSDGYAGGEQPVRVVGDSGLDDAGLAGAARDVPEQVGDADRGGQGRGGRGAVGQAGATVPAAAAQVRSGDRARAAAEDGDGSAGVADPRASGAVRGDRAGVDGGGSRERSHGTARADREA